MSIHVIDFKWEKGKNDIQYIELLEKTLKNEQAITAKAVAKIRELSAEIKEAYGKGYNQGGIDRAEELKKCREYGYNKAIDEFAERLKSDEFQKYNLDMVFETSRDLSYTECIDDFHEYVDEIAEQLKGGAE